MKYLVKTFGIALFGFPWLASIPEYIQHSWNYVHGHFLTAEGVAEDFQPMQYLPHSTECFNVNGVRFCYSDFQGASACFQHSSLYGGPIEAVAQVRIAHNGNCILRLEIASNVSH